MSKYIVSLLQKTSKDTFMSDKKTELSDAMKKKVEPRVFTKNPILGTKFTIAISSAKGGVGPLPEPFPPPPGGDPQGLPPLPLKSSDICQSI